MKIIKIIFNWIIFLAIIAAGYYVFAILEWRYKPVKMSGPEIIFFSLALAFGWVEVLHWGVTKPFNCLKCMTGWFALTLAIIFGADYYLLYLPAGVFVGALFTALKDRWL